MENHEKAKNPDNDACRRLGHLEHSELVRRLEAQHLRAARRIGLILLLIFIVPGTALFGGTVVNPSLGYAVVALCFLILYLPKVIQGIISVFKKGTISHSKKRRNHDSRHRKI